jgi:hypothetical protein
MVHHQRHWSSSPRDELIAYVQKTIDEPPLEGLWWADDLQISSAQ